MERTLKWHGVTSPFPSFVNTVGTVWIPRCGRLWLSDVVARTYWSRVKLKNICLKSLHPFLQDVQKDKEESMHWAQWKLSTLAMTGNSEDKRTWEKSGVVSQYSERTTGIRQKFKGLLDTGPFWVWPEVPTGLWISTLNYEFIPK